MPKRLSGINPLSYRGVEALQPPNITESKTLGTVTARPPTVNDYAEFNEGDLWMVTRPTTDPIPYELWYLARKTGTALGPQAIWVQLYPQGGAGGGNLRSDDTLISVPDPLGVINVWGGSPYVVGSDIRLGDPNYVNIYTVQYPDINTLEVVLKRSINQPLTNVTATEGMYSLGGLNFMHNYGSYNTALGHASLNLALDTVTAVNNTAIGFNTLHEISHGFNCTALGYRALENAVDSQYLIGLGAGAGTALGPNDSDDILIGSPGVAGDLNTIRIGIMGVGAGEQEACYVAGIWNGVAVPGKDTGLVLVDEDGKLYVDDLEPNSCVFTDATGNPIAVKGPVGTVLTGHGILPADPSPEFLPLESAGGTVTISTNPITGALNLEAAGVAGLVTLTSDLGVVLPLLGNINVIGGDLINTDNLVANTVTVNLDKSTLVPAAHCEIVTGMGPAAASIYKELFSSDGSILFDLASDPTKIDITAPGGGGGALSNLKDMNDIACNPVLGAIKIDAGDNIETTTMAPGILEVRVTDDVDLAGHLYATTDVKTSTGNLVATAGHLLLPDTNNTGTEGTIKFGGLRWISNFGNSNTFVGNRSGNFTLDPANATGNTGLGLACHEALTVGAYNTASGFDSSSKITSGGYNFSGGMAALNHLVTGSYNCAAGAYSGSNYTGNEHSNIAIMARGTVGDAHQLRLGTHGVGDGQQSDCYIAGIRDAAAGTSPEMVVIGTIASGYKVWSMAIPSGGVSDYVTDSGTASPAGGILNVKGRYNINTEAAGNTVTVNLNDSILLPITNDTCTDGCIALGVKGATTYETDRFIHAYGGGLGMTGYNTFIGYKAGRPSATALGLNNTAAGGLSLDAYTSGSNNCAYGKGALGSLTSSSSNVAVGVNSGASLTAFSPGSALGSNILLGTNAGFSYTTAYSNIVLGDDSSSAGNATETRTMRLGFKQTWVTPPPTEHDPDPVETLTVHGTDNTYMYGVYKNTVAYSGTPVYVDHLGKLGTGGGAMFAFRQTTPIVNATGDATLYIFGTSGGLTLDFDNTGSVVLGGAGAPAVFTAPYAGKYVFTASITMSIPASPPVPRPVAKDPLYVFTDNLSYSYSNYMPASTTFIQNVSEIVTTVVYLNAGDHVYWGCAAGTAAQAKNISIESSDSVIAPAPIGLKTCASTYFSGYRVS